MKRSLLLFVLGMCAGASFAAEPFDISASRLRIEMQEPAQEPYLPLSTFAAWASGDRLPIYDRLYLGGSNNLRAFKFRDVSPSDIFGEPIEYTFPIIEKVRGAVFYDIGIINRGEYAFSIENVTSDAGIGVRLDLPIGPVRLDYGIPIRAERFTGEERYSPRLDAPGPAYREQRERFGGL